MALQSSELLEKTLPELNVLLREYQGDLYLLRFKASTGQLETTHKISQIRRDVARIQTIIQQKLQNKEKPPKNPKRKKTLKKVETVETKPEEKDNPEVVAEQVTIATERQVNQKVNTNLEEEVE